MGKFLLDPIFRPRDKDLADHSNLFSGWEGKYKYALLFYKLFFLAIDFKGEGLPGFINHPAFETHD